MKNRIFGILTLVIFVVELILCFNGPFAFIHKPTLMLFPPFASGMSDEEVGLATESIERELALSNSYSIISNSFIEEYYIRTDPDKSRTKLDVKNASEALEIAQELGLERYAIGTIWQIKDAYQVSLSIRTARDGKTIKTAKVYTDTLKDLSKGTSRDGTPIDFRESLVLETKGIGLTDMLILGLLAILLAVGIVGVLGRNPGFLVELLLAPAIILFLFSFIHAQSANMDYVQRYIANGGALRQAQSTAKAQLYAILRFGPILLLGFLQYSMANIQALRSSRKVTTLRPQTWLERYVQPWSLVWTLVSAGLYSLSFPSFVRLAGIGPLAWISLVPLLLVIIANKPIKAIFCGVVFGTIQALIVNYWHGTYNYVTLHMITIAFVVEYTLFMIPFVLTIRFSGKWGFLTAPAVWTLFDYLRSSGILAYPWALAGTSQYGFLSLIQIASVTGVWGIGFVVVLANAGITWAIAGPYLGWRWPLIGRIRHGGLRGAIARSIPAIAAVLVSLIAIGYGAVVLGNVRDRLANAEQSATVVLVQQNTDPRKHEYKKNTDVLMRLTDQALGELAEKPDLVAWPEGGFKLDVTYWTQQKNQNAYWARVVRNFLDYQKGLGTWLMTGTQDHQNITGPDGVVEKRNFNSSLLLDSSGEINGFYHKMRLVPFSEHFPLDKEKYAALYEMFQEYDISNWTVGESRDVFQHEKMRIATPICFEDVFPDHVRRFIADDVDLILNMSNDFWSLSPVEGRQHGILSLFRAVENQRPVLRSTSSGYTVYISATGEIQPGAPEPYTEGYTVARVPLPDTYYTLYTKLGDWFPKFCGLFAVAVLLAIGLHTLRKSILAKSHRNAVADGEVTYHRDVV